MQRQHIIVNATCALTILFVLSQSNRWFQRNRLFNNELSSKWSKKKKKKKENKKKQKEALPYIFIIKEEKKNPFTNYFHRKMSNEIS